MNDQQGFTVWFTGLPFSGKKKLAAMVEAKLQTLGWTVEYLDGGKIRREFSPELGYSREAVTQNIRRLCFESQLVNEAGAVAVVVSISPYKDLRKECREKIKRYVEVWCKARMEVLKKRDTKGLYEKAEKGEIPDVAGISAPYEEPDNPEVVFDSENDDFKTGLGKIMSTLQLRGFIKDIGEKVLTEEEEQLIKKRLQDLGHI
ncbi:MAG: adenylyl-sulfate kinase [Candidatus Aminicenantes bacterium]|nr:adenylyl-sulfate kinase [Candidatus Aminicenantes bacterium]